MPEALTQALAKLAEKWEAEAGPHGLTEWGEDLRRCAREVRAALAGAAPTPPLALADIFRAAADQIVAEEFHMYSGWPDHRDMLHDRIAEQLRVAYDLGRGASEGSRGAFPEVEDRLDSQIRRVF